MRSEPPSGQQVELRAGAQRAVVVEVGGGLREYEVDGQPVLDGYPVDVMVRGGRGAPLLPWPNRIADGMYTFDGQQLQLPIDELAHNAAIHGLTRWRSWTVATAEVDRASFETIVRPQPGYPFTLELRISYQLAQSGLTVQTAATNRGPRRLPFGAGQHPYLTVGTPLVDTAVLTTSAATRIELDASRGVPTGRQLPVTGTPLDFAAPRPIGSQILDDCLTDLARDERGRAHAVLRHPTTYRGIDLWLDAGYRYLQLFTGDTLAAPARRRGLAIEPMTCPPNAFQTGTDLRVLEPGESITLEWGITPLR